MGAGGSPPGRSPHRVRAARHGDRLDLDELAGIPKDGNTQQRARRVMTGERRPDDLPSSHQITPITGRDIDRRLQHVSQARARSRQRLDQIRDRLPGLQPDITRTNDQPVLIKRARARSEDQGTR